MDLVFDIKEGFSKEVKTNDTLVLIGKSDYTPNNQKVLQALLSAIKLDENSVDISIYDENGGVYLPSGYKNCLLFGYQQSYFKNTNFVINKVFEMESGKVLLTSSIDEMVKDKNQKIALWQQLQKMFLNKKI